MVKKNKKPQDDYPDTLYVYISEYSAGKPLFVAAATPEDALWEDDPENNDICVYKKHARGKVVKHPVTVELEE